MGAADSKELSRSHVSLRIIHFKRQRRIWCPLGFNLSPESTQKSERRDATRMRRRDFTPPELTEKRRQVRDGLQEGLGVHRPVWRKSSELVIQENRHGPAVKSAAEPTAETAAAAAEQERTQTRNSAPGGRSLFNRWRVTHAGARREKNPTNSILRY